MDLTGLTGVLGYVVYCAQAIVALWGAYCVVTIWRRVSDLRFRSEAEQDAVLAPLETALFNQHYASVEKACADDHRAVTQLTALAARNHHLGVNKLRHMLADRFQRDVLADVEYRLSWVHTVIKSSPMLGLFGTVVGMMGAFAKISEGQNVEASRLATDISVALTTTAVGLAIAIPLLICVASINIRVRKMEDLISHGLTRVVDAMAGAERR